LENLICLACQADLPLIKPVETVNGLFFAPPNNGDCMVCDCCGTFLRYRNDRIEVLNGDDLATLPKWARKRLGELQTHIRGGMHA